VPRAICPALPTVAPKNRVDCCVHVYVHVPFCARRCSYCDFSIAVRRATPVAEYLEALRTELAGVQPSRVHTVYIGGGTPSRLGADGVRELLAIVRERYTPAPDAEITLEANPDDITAANAAAWREAGVNRLSVGVQSFDDTVLQWMHRTHDASAAARAVEAARGAGFANISLDLIFALPEALGRDWGNDLNLALSLSPEHVSLYGLTIEPSTPLARWRDRGAVRETPEERYEQEFLLAHDALSAAGYEHYEVSNFARSGLRSRHNQAYWSLVPYAGHGPSAHSYDGAVRSWNVPAYMRWLQLLASGSSVVAGSEALSMEQRSLEQVYLGLRTLQGYQVQEAVAGEVARWVESGWAERRGPKVVLTPTGWLRLDALTAALTEHGSHCNV
jgi:oxygen-independent coproporphyrinogen III oxidase